MSYFLLLLCFSVALSDDHYEFTTKYIDIPLDHFSFTTNYTFKLRYLVNDSYYTDGRPIFFYTGNEGDISMFAQNTGFMFDIAVEFEALIVFAEHRYSNTVVGVTYSWTTSASIFYGETLPFGNLSYASPTTLGYLSAQQALADFVYLINDLQKQYAPKSGPLKKSPVIAFGGSYGGMLSGWLRMKYPHIVDGAIASSAPIWQFNGITPCGNFFKIVTDVTRSLGSQKCVDIITKSWSILRNLTSTDRGKADVSSIFKLCKPLQTNSDIATLLNWLSEIYTNIVMVNYPYPTSFLVPLPGNPVKTFCRGFDNFDRYNEIDVENDDNDILKSINQALQIYTNYTGQTKCNDILLTASASLGERGWNFQSCTDMIMPMCSTNEDMFENVPWDFKSFSDSCFEQYSVRPRSEEVPILEFGGKDLQSASNIIFSNGLLDPWSSGGVLTNISSSVLAVLIPDGAHHFDLRGENPLDSESVKSAREFHKNQIRKWLDKFYFKNFPQEYYLFKKKTVMSYL